MGKWISAGKDKYGLRYREHTTETTGVGRRKRPLRYYAAVYKWQGKTVTDAYGWEGLDFHNEDDIVQTALLLRTNRRNKVPPFTLRELLDERQQALNKEKERIRQEEANIAREERTKLDNVFDLYCTDNTHKKSLRDEKSYYRNWIKSPLGRKRLDEIVLLDLERIRKKMTAAGKAPRSIGYIKSIIRQIYNYAIERDLYSGSIPTLHFLKKTRTDNKRRRYLSPDEADLLLNKIRQTSEQTYRICLLSLNSGLRFGEIASLRWQHINADRREIIIIDPKNGESRSVYMTEAVRAMFNEMQKGDPADLAFPSRTGGKMASISKTFARAVSDIGLNEGITDRRMRVVFHTLRHSCASWLVNAGVEIPVIAKILGHKSLQMTMRYSHVNDTSVQGAMRMLDQQQGRQERKALTVHNKQ